MCKWNQCANLKMCKYANEADVQIGSMCKCENEIDVQMRPMCKWD